MPMKADSGVVIPAMHRFTGKKKAKQDTPSAEELIQSCLTTQFVDFSVDAAIFSWAEGTKSSPPNSSGKTDSTGLKRSSLVLVKS